MVCRNTFVEVNLNNIEENVKKIISQYNQYKYYFGVVKADCYGHNDLEVVKRIIKGGCNYLAVATLDEALQIRKEIKDIPILCLGIMPCKYIKEYVENNITMTISSLEQLNEIVDFEGLKVHIKINTGMNRLGINNSNELMKVYNKLKTENVEIEGVYTHIYNAENEQDYNMQIRKFENLIKFIDIQKIPIIHISASEAMVNYPKATSANGCRLGIIMYGFTHNKQLGLKSTFALNSEVIQINKLKAGDSLGYNGAYKPTIDTLIAVIPIGYADGIIRKNTGRNVYINDKEYKIVGNVCMDMLFVEIDDTVKIHDKVVLLKNVDHIESVAKHLETIPYEVLCSIGKRVPRKYTII